MKSKIIAIVLFVLLLVVGYKFYVLQDYTEALKIESKKKDKLIAKSAEVDSVIIEKTKEYVKTIKEYNEVSSFSRNGKEISSSQIVEEFNQLIEKNNSLTDSINFYKKKNGFVTSNLNDSISNLNWVLQVLQKRYQFKYKLVKSKNALTMKHQMSTLDSALVLFPYYRHTLSLDGDTWTIQTDKTYRKNKKRKESESNK